MTELPICTKCQEPDKSITNNNIHGWICDDCEAEYEHIERTKASCVEVINIIQTNTKALK